MAASSSTGERSYSATSASSLLNGRGPPMLLAVSILWFALLASAGQTPRACAPNTTPPMTNWTLKLAAPAQSMRVALGSRLSASLVCA
jgi:hypothetical protein